jgi:hypothetical protein
VATDVEGRVAAESGVHAGSERHALACVALLLIPPCCGSSTAGGEGRRSSRRGRARFDKCMLPKTARSSGPCTCRTAVLGHMAVGVPGSGRADGEARDWKI